MTFNFATEAENTLQATLALDTYISNSNSNIIDHNYVSVTLTGVDGEKIGEFKAPTNATDKFVCGGLKAYLTMEKVFGGFLDENCNIVGTPGAFAARVAETIGARLDGKDGPSSRPPRPEAQDARPTTTEGEAEFVRRALSGINFENKSEQKGSRDLDTGLPN